jgi:hypothetical protein
MRSLTWYGRTQLVVTRQYRPIACSSSNTICVNCMMKADISTVLTTVLVVVHIGLTAVDFLGMAPMADFIVRHDGSQMQAHNMLPLEELFVAMLSFPFFIIVMAFMVTNRKDAAALSIAIHGVFALHQIWNKPKWDAIMHPNSEHINTNFFILSHVGWVIISGIIWFLNLSPGNTPNKDKDS